MEMFVAFFMYNILYDNMRSVKFPSGAVGGGPASQEETLRDIAVARAVRQLAIPTRRSKCS